MICSFPSCRNDGIKFLYCEHCRDAVGKRVFRNQHHHLDDEEAPLVAAGQVLHSKPGDRADESLAETSDSQRLPGTLRSSNEVWKGDADSVGKETVSKEETPSIIPCRARGMPKEHDYKVRRSMFCLIRDKAPE